MDKSIEFTMNLISRTVIENEQYFSELDSVVGDGDFGYSLARGFEKVLAEWESLDHSTPGNFLKKISSIIIRSVGGVSGTIWGTAFLHAGMTMGTKTEFTRPEIIDIFRSVIEGIKKRGNCDLGDKTYLDALVPAINALEKAFNEGKGTTIALNDAAFVARESAEATRQMIAKRGRAAYTGNAASERWTLALLQWLFYSKP